jgi:hypothetical protein
MVLVCFANFVYYKIYMTQINPYVTVTDYRRGPLSPQNRNEERDIGCPLDAFVV